MPRFTRNAPRFTLHALREHAPPLLKRNNSNNDELSHDELGSFIFGPSSDSVKESTQRRKKAKDATFFYWLCVLCALGVFALKVKEIFSKLLMTTYRTSLVVAQWMARYDGAPSPDYEP